MIRSAMNDIPEENWDLAFKKKEPPKEHDGGWIEEQLDNQQPKQTDNQENNGKG